MKQRLQMLSLALLLSVPLIYFVLPWHTRYWLIADGTEGTALVTEEGSHGSVYYTYVVAGETFHGHSQANWRDDRYRHAKVGDRPPVWYSASRPSLSMLYRPEFVAEGAVGVLIILILEVPLIVTALRPAWGRRLWLGGRAG